MFYLYKYCSNVIKKDSAITNLCRYKILFTSGMHTMIMMSLYQKA